MTIEQGSIIKIEELNGYYLVVSRKIYNMSEQIIVVPIIENGKEETFRIPVNSKYINGVAICDEIRKIDISIRGYSVVSFIDNNNLFPIISIIQDLFQII